MLNDSGNRREFETGAVRDIQVGKGRCDLLPMDVVSEIIPITSEIANCIALYQYYGKEGHLINAAQMFAEYAFNGYHTALLELSKHFEEGAQKYGEYNWQKGIPTSCYIDSAVRHYLKYLRGDDDERHDRAFLWNLVCCIWTCRNLPELNVYPLTEDKNGTA